MAPSMPAKIPIGTLIRNTLFQPKSWTSKPPNGGPTIVESATAKDVAESDAPRFSTETADVIKALLVATIIDPKIACTIREPISITMLIERPQTRDAAVNPATPHK